MTAEACHECGTPLDQVPFKACNAHAINDRWDTMVKAAELRKTAFVPDKLRKCADIYEERNKLYKDNYKSFGKVIDVLFPDGIPSGPQEPMKDYHNRVAILLQIVAKLTRYCANFDRGGHEDSLMDTAVYAMMLNELDLESNYEMLKDGKS